MYFYIEPFNGISVISVSKVPFLVSKKQGFSQWTSAKQIQHPSRLLHRSNFEQVRSGKLAQCVPSHCLDPMTMEPWNSPNFYCWKVWFSLDKNLDLFKGHSIPILFHGLLSFEWLEIYSSARYKSADFYLGFVLFFVRQLVPWFLSLKISDLSIVSLKDCLWRCPPKNML